MTVCFWCSRVPGKPTRDHLIPRWARFVFRRHGLTVPSDLLRREICCRGCNGYKGPMPPAVFAEVRYDPKARRAANKEWHRRVQFFVGPWHDNMPKATAADLAELQRAMSRRFFHNWREYPADHRRVRVPWSVIEIDASRLTHQPIERRAESE